MESYLRGSDFFYDLRQRVKNLSNSCEVIYGWAHSENIIRNLKDTRAIVIKRHNINNLNTQLIQYSLQIMGRTCKLVGAVTAHSKQLELNCRKREMMVISKKKGYTQVNGNILKQLNLCNYLRTVITSDTSCLSSWQK